MAPSINNGNKNHNLWVKKPDGNITELTPGKTLAPNPMTAGKYNITSVEIVPEPAPNVPDKSKDVTVVNVGQETLVFICTTDDDKNFILASTKSKVLSDVDYVIHSIHIA